MDPQELLERQYAPERGLINQERGNRLPQVPSRQKTTFINLIGRSEINCLALNGQKAGGITDSEGFLRQQTPGGKSNKSSSHSVFETDFWPIATWKQMFQTPRATRKLHGQSNWDSFF